MHYMDGGMALTRRGDSLVLAFYRRIVRRFGQAFGASCTAPCDPREGLTRICFYRGIHAAFWQMLDASCISRPSTRGSGLSVIPSVTYGDTSPLTGGDHAGSGF